MKKEVFDIFLQARQMELPLEEAADEKSAVINKDTVTAIATVNGKDKPGPQKKPKGKSTPGAIASVKDMEPAPVQ